MSAADDQAPSAEVARGTVWRYLGRPMRVSFAVANTPIEVPHGLAVVPDGWVVIDTDARVNRAPGLQWTPTLAYLQVTAAPAYAVVAFGVLREDVQNVQASA